MTSIDQSRFSTSENSSITNTVSRKQLFSIFRGIQQGQLTIEENGEFFVFGNTTATNKLHAQITINHSSAYRDILFGGSIGGAEAYIRSSWDSPRLVDLVRLMAINIDFLNSMDDSRRLLQKITDKIYHYLNRNTEARSKQNIAAHYDLGNEFYSLILDRRMMYSSAIFEDVNASLEAAASHKLEVICRKLELGKDDHLLEIGTGWGGLAIYAAENFGCKVTTTTISQQQYDYASQQVARHNLEDKITVLKQDYRDLRGQFDKLVSVEMIEAVGHQYYRKYFTQCSHLLKPQGLMFIQAITIPDDRYQYALKSVDFIQRYIFPGGSLPSQQAIAGCIRKFTDMQIIDMEEIGEHYAKTLQHWRIRFHDKLGEVRQLGFDESFLRMWDYYLCYCEGAFQERVIGTAQYLFAKPGWRNTPVNMTSLPG